MIVSGSPWRSQAIHSASIDDDGRFGDPAGSYRNNAGCLHGWTGRVCRACQGGVDDDGNPCDACAGTGEAFGLVSEPYEVDKI